MWSDAVCPPAGNPKGAMLTHSGFTAVCAATQKALVCPSHLLHDSPAISPSTLPLPSPPPPQLTG